MGAFLVSKQALGLHNPGDSETCLCQVSEKVFRLDESRPVKYSILSIEFFGLEQRYLMSY